MHDLAIGFALSGQADRTTTLEDRADGMPSANLLSHPMQTERSLLGMHRLADAET